MSHKEQTLKSKLVTGGGLALFTMFVWELLEEGIENLLAYTITSVTAIFVTKALSTLGIVIATQSLKTLLKRGLTPVIKELTYKEGNDKMNKLKSLFSYLGKFGSWLNANKCTIGGVGLGALTMATGTGIVDVATLPAILVNSFNITPVLYYVLLGVLIIVVSFFPESVEKFTKRIADIKAEKEQNALVKEAKKELDAEEKLANQTQAQKEKEQAKADKELKLKQEKEKAEAEHRAKLDAVKAELKAQTK